MKTTIKFLTLCLVFLAMACSKDDVPTTTTPTPTPTPVVTKSSAKDITKFSFAALSPAVDATIDATAKTISATLPAATDLTKLVPTITLSDKATISPATGVAQDFSKEVSYTVTAEDASTVVWKVNVKKEVVVVGDLAVYQNLKITSLKGAAFGTANQKLLFNATKGLFFSIENGASNATDIDFIFSLNSSNASGDIFGIYSPSIYKTWASGWGSIIDAQMWSIYNPTKLGDFSSNYPASVYWSKLNSAQDITDLIKKLNLTIAPTALSLMTKDGSVNTTNICVFQTSKGKWGIIRAISGSVDANSQTVTIDVKVQN